MARFEIDGKEYELKLTYTSVKHLNGLFEGGSLELIGKALMGDLGAFPLIVHAALFHTEKNFALKAVEDAIENAFNAEKIDQDYVLRVSNEVVCDSFFYKKTVAKMLAKDERAATVLADILK